MPHDIHGIDVHRDGDENRQAHEHILGLLPVPGGKLILEGPEPRIEQSLEPREISVCTRAKIDEDTANGRLLRKPFGQAADLADLGKGVFLETLDLREHALHQGPGRDVACLEGFLHPRRAHVRKIG